jgi:tetratricopeptide (TPR) repeat protein
MAAAHKLYAEGKLEQAEKVLSATLKALPDHPDAHHLLGVVRQATGDADAGIHHVEKAIALAPNRAQFKANLCEMYRRAERLDDAIRIGHQAVQQAPDLAIAHGNLGIALFDNDDPDGAEACQNRTLALNPNQPQALNNLGSIARSRKDSDAAIDWYTKALNANPDYDEAAGNLGTVLIEADRAKEALATLLPLVRKSPNRAETHCALGRAFLQLDDLDRAEIGFRQAMKLGDATYQMHLGMSQVLQEKNHADLALVEAQKALILEPDTAACHHQVGLCNAELACPDLAEICSDRALALDPDFVPTLLARGYLHMEAGDMAAAQSLFQRAIELKPTDFSARLARVRLTKIKADNADYAYLQDHEKDAADMPSKKALTLHFALGKCHEDVGAYVDAFASFSKGCAKKRAIIKYDADATDARVDRIIETFDFDTATLDHLRAAANPSAMPIFVLGMPRSGTTLTETILASHPDVFGAGELNDLQRLFPLDSGSADQLYPTGIKHINLDTLAQRAAKYVAQLCQRAPAARRITDKMPANFFHVGLIHALLPNARIVHVQRDPLDTCLSCYTRLFERSQYQSYDLTELARYYRSYHKLMEHWRNLLPKGAFLDFAYEDLIDDFEPQTRRLVDFCGLDWDDACLYFHTTKRSVRTASVTQVRQPVYKSSVRKWKAYEPFLGPMITALGDLAPDQ